MGNEFLGLEFVAITKLKKKFVDWIRKFEFESWRFYWPEIPGTWRLRLHHGNDVTQGIRFTVSCDLYFNHDADTKYVSSYMKIIGSLYRCFVNIPNYDACNYYPGMPKRYHRTQERCPVRLSPIIRSTSETEKQRSSSFPKFLFIRWKYKNKKTRQKRLLQFS